MICGHFEGVDERILNTRNIEEISIGDYVLSGGESAAFVVIDSILRLLPGVIGNEISKNEESFENGLLEYPQYTKPKIWEEKSVPEVLLSGNHKEINEWILKNREAKTKNKTDISVMVGKALAEKAKKEKLGPLVLDRNGYPYHGRVKVFAEAARENGLEF